MEQQRIRVWSCTLPCRHISRNIAPSLNLCTLQVIGSHHLFFSDWQLYWHIEQTQSDPDLDYRSTNSRRVFMQWLPGTSVWHLLGYISSTRIVSHIGHTCSNREAQHHHEHNLCWEGLGCGDFWSRRITSQHDEFSNETNRSILQVDISTSHCSVGFMVNQMGSDCDSWIQHHLSAHWICLYRLRLPQESTALRNSESSTSPITRRYTSNQDNPRCRIHSMATHQNVYKESSILAISVFVDTVFDCPQLCWSDDHLSDDLVTKQYSHWYHPNHCDHLWDLSHFHRTCPHYSRWINTRWYLEFVMAVFLSNTRCSNAVDWKRWSLIFDSHFDSISHTITSRSLVIWSCCTDTSSEFSWRESERIILCNGVLPTKHLWTLCFCNDHYLVQAGGLQISCDY